jgi:hypothetical protein
MKKNQIEILPSPAAIVHAQTGHNKAEFERAVRQQVAEIMAERDAVVFEPFFRSRQVAYELKRLMTVPEQEKFSIGYERYGCIDCKTHATPHAGNNMCQKCRGKWFGRLAQIIGEGIKGEPAQRARGTARAERLLPENAPQDGVHRTWHQRSSRQELLLYASVAVKLGVTRDHVRLVATGGYKSRATGRRCNSGIVLAALKEERSRLNAAALKEGRSGLEALAVAKRKWGSGVTP